MDHDHKYEDIIREMHGNIKELVVQVKTLNNSVANVKREQYLHEEDAVGYRRKIDRIWTGVHIAKWIILIITASGVLWRIYG